MNDKPYIQTVFDFLKDAPTTWDYNEQNQSADSERTTLPDFNVEALD